MMFGGLSFPIAAFPPAARERGITLRPYWAAVRLRVKNTLLLHSGAPGDRQRAVPNRKGIANQTGPESCVAHREVRDEALTGEPAGQPPGDLLLGRSSCNGAVRIGKTRSRSR